MKHFRALIVKFFITSVVLEAVLWNLTALSFTSIIYIASAVTLISYLAGDVGILPVSNNTVATIADLVIAFVTIWLFNFVFTDVTITFSDALIASAGIAVGEWLFHKFVSREVLPSRR